ncbi:hypothetical protein [Streptomyces sp. NPDC093225]|uniref:hypothetical protein n=1 Tax=Streptomyces sp. NPDC093225 TaxID=3366034 RepID=UPI00381055C6
MARPIRLFELGLQAERKDDGREEAPATHTAHNADHAPLRSSGTSVTAGPGAAGAGAGPTGAA